MRQLSTQTPKHLCSGCGKVLSTTSKGLIIQHDRMQALHGRLVMNRCPGAGRPPVPLGRSFGGAAIQYTPGKAPGEPGHGKPCTHPAGCTRCSWCGFGFNAFDISLAPLKDPANDGRLTGQCPSCGTDQALLSADDIKAHLGNDGECCPGSRGAPTND